MSSNEGTENSDGGRLTPSDSVAEARVSEEDLLPEKSREKYESVYLKFMDWRKTRKTKKLSEDEVMEYFSELAQKMKPSTLWSNYSMLKRTIKTNDNINIGNYKKLKTYLKTQSSGFKSEKSQVLTPNQIEKFLNEAPDDEYLATKVALILGITGACRRNELCSITMNDIEDDGSILLIKIPDTKPPRSFTVVGEFYNIFKKYVLLRPRQTHTDRLFLQYHNGKCTQGVIGVNKFGSMPKQIAKWLNLPDPESFTGHSFRRTSATLLADSGADITTLKSHGGWKSKGLPEGFIQDSICRKRKICEQITESVILKPSFPNNNSNFGLSTAKRKTQGNQVNLGASTSRNCNSSTNDKDLETSETIVTPTNKNMFVHIKNCSNLSIEWNQSEGKLILSQKRNANDPKKLVIHSTPPVEREVRLGTEYFTCDGENTSDIMLVDEKPEVQDDNMFEFVCVDMPQPEIKDEFLG